MFLLAVQGLAQKATLSLDSTSILIGDQVTAVLKVTLPADAVVRFPEFSDTLTGAIEVVSQRPVDSVRDENLLRASRKFILTSFDTGYHAIPPLKVPYAIDTVLSELTTEPLLLHVAAMKVDTAQPIKPIKGPVGAPLTFRELLPWIIGGLLLALLVIGLIYYLKKRKKHEPVFRPKPKPLDPPHIEALKNLDALEDQKLWQNGRFKDFYSGISHIMRMYLERKFEFPAVENTTTEIMDEISRKDIDSSTQTELQELMALADMVKFAKVEPLPSENEKVLKQAKHFVTMTKDFGHFVETAPKEPQNPDNDAE
jgi:hypothetical protein